MECLFCRRANCVPSGRYWYCTHCRVTFDAQDDGDATIRPERRLERAEERAAREAQKRKERRFR